jgi:hypothetical protein
VTTARTRKKPGKTAFTVEHVPLSQLKPHPRNYREHPDDQLSHLIESLREHGFYRNVLIAKDGTILAGHGIIEAARVEGYTEAPCVRLDLDPEEPRALKVLAADNELSRLAEVDDRALSELLKEVKDFDLDGLLGTGYDEQMLANLVMVTRPANEIATFDEAAEWVGMPEYEAAQTPYKVWVSFQDEAAKHDFEARLGITLPPNSARCSMWWPPKEREDPSSLRFDAIPISDEDAAGD